jgi:hypothetical protein
MKLYLIAATTALFILSSNNAYAVQEWRGAGFVTYQNQACVNAGAAGAIGDIHFRTVRYRPPNISDNGASTRLVFFGYYSASSYKLLTGNLTNVYKNVEAGSTFSTNFLHSNQASMRVLQQNPANLAENSPFVRLRGQIRNFQDSLNCRVLFDVTLTRVP